MSEVYTLHYNIKNKFYTTFQDQNCSLHPTVSKYGY